MTRNDGNDNDDNGDDNEDGDDVDHSKLHITENLSEIYTFLRILVSSLVAISTLTTLYLGAADEDVSDASLNIVSKIDVQRE